VRDVKIYLLAGGMTALMANPSWADPAGNQEIKPSPCDVRKIMKVTTGADGKEILTSVITADCGYDSNFVKKYNQLRQEIKEQFAELNQRMIAQEIKPPSVIIKEIQPEPVDLKPIKVESKHTEWSWIEFFIGMLQGFKGEKV
jgi:hypothetical protein|tara:strand:- start:153 stop:581 length:429 start_codon:yes stop_codon:yes gene_type:complete